jgi:solute:Na+ symporter, SSS family
MHFHTIDLIILGLYVLTTISIGFLVAHLAKKNIKHYFLGGNKIPWYYLGLSNASGMYDISGTMWLVYLLFIYGLKSIWIPWLWPVFNQIFLMVFLSIWLRRSGVMTGAEWIRFRFGESRGAHLAHIVVVVFAVINVIGFIAYGFIGIGKFASAFLPWQLSTDPQINVYAYGLIISAITTVYVVKGGMFSVVFTEVLQYIIMTIASVWVGIIAMNTISPAMLDAVIPDGWRNPFFGWTLDLDWTGIMDTANLKIAEDGWNIFGLFFMMMLFKGWLQAGAGPAPNYDMQRILAATKPTAAAKMSGLVSLVLNIPRYMLITGLTVLALVFFSDQLNEMGAAVDFELVLPFALSNFIPTGLLGLLTAALIAAFMSTYAATVNAAPAYIVNDIYKRFINPNAEPKVYVRWSYAISLLVVVLGTAFGFILGTIHDVVQWIVAALYGGYTASNVLKWYWWRFNSYGYFWGMVAGILGSMIFPAIYSNVPVIYIFPLILLVSVIGCIAGTLLTPPDDEQVLKRFYIKVRPWGFWGPVYNKVVAEYPDLKKNTDFKRDMVNVIVGIAWQTALVAGGVFVVIQQWDALIICLAIVLVTSTFLKYNWYDKMVDYPDHYAEEIPALPDSDNNNSESNSMK